MLFYVSWIFLLFPVPPTSTHPTLLMIMFPKPN